MKSKFVKLSRTVALAGLAFTFLHLGTAHAGSISTPIIFLGEGNQLMCIANNVSSQPVTVRVRIIGFLGNAEDTCTLPAGNKDGCQVFRNNDGGHCRLMITGLTNEQVQARIRGVLFERKTTAPFTIGGIVQAR